jgi:hypothetical protein
MPNEFIARNGLIALNNVTVTGSVTALSFTGSVLGTASYTPNLQQVTDAGAITTNKTTTNGFTSTNISDITYSDNTESNGLFLNNTSSGGNSIAAVGLGASTEYLGGLIGIPSSYVSSAKRKLVSLVSYGENRLGIIANYNSSGSAQDIIFSNYGNISTPQLQIKGNTSNILVNTNTDTGEKFQVAGSGRFTDNLIVTGNIGIGVTAPTASLVVSGSSILASTLRFYTGVNDSVPGYSDFRTNPATGNLTISAQTNALFFNFDHGSGGVMFGNGASGTVGAVDSSGNAYFTGALSLGVSSTAAKLLIRGTGTTSATTTLLVQNANASSSLVVLDNGNVYSYGPGFITSNTAFGFQALNNPSGSATQNAAFGIQNLSANNYSGFDNVAIGYRAIQNATTGYQNMGIGTETLQFLTTGFANTAVGHSVLRFATLNGANTGIGYYSLYTLGANQGNSNTGIGSYAFQLMTTGSNNIGIGAGSGAFKSGSFNIFIGASNNQILTGSGNVIIGNNQSLSSSLNNTIAISDGSGNMRIYVSSSGNIGIGTSFPIYKLDVSGSGNFTSNLTVTGSITATQNLTLGTNGRIASGDFATPTGNNSIAMGYGNTSTGNSSMTVGFISNTDSAAEYGAAIGYEARSYLPGQISFAYGNHTFNARDAGAQQSFITVKNSAGLTTGTTMDLSIGGTSITFLGASRAWMVTMDWVATVSSITGTATGVIYGDTAGGTIRAVVKKVGGVVSVVGIITNDKAADVSLNAVAMTFVAGGSANLIPRFTGPTFAGGGTVTMKVVGGIKLSETTI